MVKGEPDNTPGNRKKQSEFFRYLGVASTVGINLSSKEVSLSFSRL
jgi:hypothetical protein